MKQMIKNVIADVLPLASHDHNTMLAADNSALQKAKIMFNYLKHLISIYKCKFNVSNHLFIDKIWNKDLKHLSKNKIYCYQEPNGGIYKTMQLSLIGNEDVDSKVEMNTYFAFVRIDNICGYCQFQYKEMEKLFKHHLSSLHKDFIIYEFESQAEFVEWCYSRPKQYFFKW